MKRPRLVSLLICAYCTANAADLVWPWLHSRGWCVDSLAFSLWSSPIFAFWSFRRAPAADAGDRPLLLGLAILLSFFGAAASLGLFCHLGFALSLSALLPAMPLHFTWMASSFSWMPVLEYLLAGRSPGCVVRVKLAAASLPSLILVWHIVLKFRRMR